VDTGGDVDRGAIFENPVEGARQRAERLRKAPPIAEDAGTRRASGTSVHGARARGKKLEETPTRAEPTPAISGKDPTTRNPAMRSGPLVKTGPPTSTGVERIEARERVRPVAHRADS
jgi:hypothetical protein